MTELEGTNVRLRGLVAKDYATVHAWYSDPELVAPHDRFSPDTFEEFVRSVETATNDPASLAPRFAIEERRTGDLVGVVGHYTAHPVLEYLDVWYLLGNRAVRGRGYGREAVGLLVGHLFATRSIERVGASVDVENAASNRLVEGLGFRREGTLRSALFHHGHWHDVNLYGITRSDWASTHPAT
jgi:RimJ/RimL family protein N-acetyltransferase